MIKYLLERKITSPLFDRDLARELMDDEGREQENRPDLPAASNVPYRFWHLNTADTLDEFIAQSNNENFNTIRLQLIAAHNQAGAGEEAQVQVEEQAAFEPQRDAIQQRAHGTIVRWYNATKEWRENNASDIHKVQKLIDLLRKAGNNASYLPQWTHQPIHIRTFVFDALNTKLYGFFQNYVGTNTYRHILERSKDNDGLDVLDKLQHVGLLPSTQSGQHYITQLAEAKQPHGISWDAYRSLITEIEDNYTETTGKQLPDDLVRLALTQRVSPFYRPVITILNQQEALGKAELPLKSTDGTLSVAKLMRSHERQNPIDFQKYLKRNKPRRARGMASANIAERQDELRELCKWCKRFRPGKPTNHLEKDCNIKKDHLQTICDVCHGKGHPTKFCPNSKGRANQAEESKAAKPAPQRRKRSNRNRRRNNSSRSGQRLTSHGLADQDELYAAEAMKALKHAHKQCEQRGIKGARFKITMINDS